MQRCDIKKLPYSCEQVFDLVADIESYPDFLPGWSSARILHSGASHMLVEQQLRLGPLDLRFQSTAELERSRRILISTSDPPFHNLTIDWRFAPQPGGHCEVRVETTLALKPGILSKPLEHLLAGGSGQLLPLFEARARSLYSGS
ncbi:MAG: type II toxin-antitoxin system RatA family toxin [Thiogranum sp.]